VLDEFDEIMLLCDRLDAPFGTAENPVEVPSEFDHRVVGVPDPDDDSLVWWGIIEDGSPPKQVSICQVELACS
jgi:hypothetical protein